MSIPMKARRAFRYAGRALTAGAPFDARNEADALILGANGNAKRAAQKPSAVVSPAVSPSVQPPSVGHYRTRVMTPEPPPQIPQSPPLITKESTPAADDLDDLDVEALRALAERRGISVHYRAGAEKLRAAIREAQKGTTEE